MSTNQSTDQIVWAVFFLPEILKCHLLHEIWEKDKSKPKVVVNIEPRERAEITLKAIINIK